MPREDLRSWQLKKLQTLVSWAYERSPFWQRKLKAAGVHPRDIRQPEDIQRIPFLTKAEIVECQEVTPLYGDILSATPTTAITYHQTSGTSGRSPVRAIDSARDWNWSAETWAYGLYGFGVRREDIVYVAFGYGAFIGFWGAHLAFEKIGALTIPGGAQTSESRIKQIMELGVTVLNATPSYAIRLAQVAREMGVDLARDSNIEIVVTAGEPGGNIPSTKAMIEEAWGAHMGDFAGMTEAGGIFGFECNEKPGGMHIVEDHFIEEVIDPTTGQSLGYGERGERVTTSFGRGMLPLLRYRTGDLVERVSGDRCPCGRIFDIYNGGIIGRVDDMKLIRGTNVFPSAVEGVIRRYPEIREFQIIITKVNHIDEIAVKLEPSPETSRDMWPDIRRRIVQDLADAHEGLRFELEIVEPDTLPTFELKARRLVDLR
jgi:phenylacetate-CoA ligase